MKKKNNIPLNFKERNHSKISLISSVAVLIVLFLIFNQIDYSLFRKPEKEAAEAAAAAQKQAEEDAAKPVITKASILAVGDNLYHTSLLESGQYESGAWDYKHVYANIKDQIQAADLAIVNQDTVFTTDHEGISSYPAFATPTEVGDALVDAGFDVVTSATNNIDDYGYENLSQTLDFWKNNYPDITLLGIHESQEDANSIHVKEVNGIKIAFLNYTYGTNSGNAALEDKTYMIDIFDKDKVASDIQKAKQMSDCIILCAHWGTEDETMPNEYEKQWAAFLLEQGVDVVLGTNPHVLQPYGRVFDDFGNSMLIYYSLGNFVTGQESLNKLLGGMATFTIQKTVQDGITSVEILTPELTPLVMHYDTANGEFGPYLLDTYTESLASSHSVREILGEEFTLSNLKSKFDEIMSMNVKPSTGTNLLNVKFDWDRNMIDKTSNAIVEDTESIQAWEYYSQINPGDSGASDNSGSYDNSDYSGDYDDSDYSGDYEDSDYSE